MMTSMRALRVQVRRGSWLGLALALGLPLGTGAGLAAAAPGAPAPGAAAPVLPVPPAAPGSKAPVAATAPGASAAPASEKTGAPQPDAGAAPVGTTAAAAAAAAPGPKSNIIKLTVRTVPAKRAFVYWGKKRLGVTDRKAPLVIQRPRDSGPLDLLVHADGCVPVYTRAYTFDDSTLAVRVTTLDQKQTIYGYKAELPPDDAAQGDVAAPGAAPLPGAGVGGNGGSLFTR